MDIQRVIEGLDALFAKKESNKVEDYLSDNLEQALQEGDVGSAVTIINELIGYYRDTSQYDKAAVYCEKLLPFMERAGLKGTIHYGTSCLNIANAYRAAGRLEDSLEHYQIALDIYDKVLEKNDFRYASFNNNLALLYQEMGEFDKAGEALCKALQIVKEHPEATVEQAVTYTNLAASYVKAGKLEQARKAAREGLAIFENGLTGDFHYSAALCVSGDISFAMKEYGQAAYCYEQAMIALKHHVGLTHAYFRIVSNLQTSYEAMGKPDALKGMVIARDYYEQFGKEAFRNLQVACSEKESIGGQSICYAKVGEGSECFGRDDILSIDHDFGPGFGVFVSKEQYDRLGKKLEEIYDSLPIDFRGFIRSEKLPGALRNGVIVIEEFFGRILSLNEDELVFLMKNQTLPKETWLRMEDWQLNTVTNGSIFDGEDSLFARIYINLKRGYPEDVWRRKIAQKLGEICQEGQYNYQRLMQRKDIYGATLILHALEEHVIEFLYLINHVYAPHKKWLLKGAEELDKGEKILESVKKLMGQIPDISTYQKRETVDWIGTTNKEDCILTAIWQIAEEVVELLIEEGLTKKRMVYLEDQVPYLLEF